MDIGGLCPPASRILWSSERGSGSNGYLADEGLSTAIFLALKLGRPLFLEGETGLRASCAESGFGAAAGQRGGIT